MQIVKEKQRFQRVVVSREEALAMFQENKFKVEIITGLPEDATISLYRCARSFSPCAAPHCCWSLGIRFPLRYAGAQLLRQRWPSGSDASF